MILMMSALVEGRLLRADIFSPSLRAYQKDCGKKVRRPSLLQRGQLPGAGMEPKSIKPFDVVLKDGFLYTKCIKDMMFEHGDKFGNNADDYRLGNVANVSIVHYTELIPKEDREPMAHEVCFRFCRTIDGMNFFGITGGHDCYCMPYFKQMAGDSSKCDSVCEGDSGTMCGGKSKSSVFSMHWCSDTAQELSDTSETSKKAADKATELGKDAEKLAEDIQSFAAKAQKTFGKTGDAVASDLMFAAKVSAGELLHTAEDVLEVAGALERDMKNADSMKDVDLTDPKKATAADKLVADMVKGAAATKKAAKKLDKLFKFATRGKDQVGRSKQYLPLMYFVDKKFQDSPSTCGGEADKHTIFVKSKDECAAACDTQLQDPKCVGFSFYDGGVCILFSKFKSVTYYTKCDDEKKAKTSCFAKLEEFQGVTLKPDSDGKCDMCLKKATKAQRCF